jgi:hypothetical protein
MYQYIYTHIYPCVCVSAYIYIITGKGRRRRKTGSINCSYIYFPSYTCIYPYLCMCVSVITGSGKAAAKDRQHQLLRHRLHMIRTTSSNRYSSTSSQAYVRIRQHTSAYATHTGIDYIWFGRLHQTGIVVLVAVKDKYIAVELQDTHRHTHTHIGE